MALENVRRYPSLVQVTPTTRGFNGLPPSSEEGTMILKPTEMIWTPSDTDPDGGYFDIPGIYPTVMMQMAQLILRVEDSPEWFVELYSPLTGGVFVLADSDSWTGVPGHVMLKDVEIPQGFGVRVTAQPNPSSEPDQVFFAIAMFQPSVMQRLTYSYPEE